MSNNIYKGYNFIYEQLAGDQKPSDSTGASDLVNSIYSTLIGLMQSNGMGIMDTKETFLPFQNELKGCKDFNSLKNSVIGLADKLPAETKEAGKKSLNDLFDQLMKIDNVNGKFDDSKKMLDGLLDATSKIIDSNSQQENANESILTEQKKGAGRLESSNSDTNNSDDDDSDDEHGRGIRLSTKWYVETANHLLDIATALKTETTVPILPEKIANDPKAKAIIAKALDLYKQATMLQIVGKRKGFIIKGLIHTKGSDLKGGDFKIKARNLDEEIRRARKELSDLKGAITGAPVVAPITPALPTPPASKTPGTEQPGSTVKKPVDNSDNCEFPIAISLMICTQVEKLQKKLMEIECINKVLSAHGGADGKFGKWTSIAANCAFSVISKKDDFKSSVLTKEMYDAIMAMNTTTNESFDKKFANQLFETEIKKGEDVLDFSSFSIVLKRSNRILEQAETSTSIVNEICQKFKTKIALVGGGKGGSKGNDKGGDGKDGGPTKGGEQDKLPPTRNEWGGLKYVIDNPEYRLPFDESLLSFWTKEVLIDAATMLLPGSTLLVKGGSVALKEMSIKTVGKFSATFATKVAAKVGAKASIEKGAVVAGEMAAKEVAAGGAAKGFQTSAASVAMKTVSKMGGSASSAEIANGLSIVRKAYFEKYGKIAIGKRATAGLLGGPILAGIADFISGRNTVKVPLVEGFIPRPVILAISNGMVDTLDGYVSGDDIECIAMLLAIVKGAWTVDSSGKAVSAWAEIKKGYAKERKNDMSKEIKGVTTNLKFGNVKIPKFESANPYGSELLDISYSIGKGEVDAFVSKLDGNESALRATLAKLPENWVRANATGDYDTISVDANDEENDEG